MLVAVFSQYFFGFTIFISSIFLIMLVLVQRGRGGGLTGALGGPGGQSAFGTKAGDLFTRITVGVAAVWIFLCAAAVFFLKDRDLPQTNVLGNVPSVISSEDPSLDGGASSLDSGSGLDGSSGLEMPLQLPSSGASPAGEPATTEAEITDATGLDLSPVQPATPAAQTPATETPATETPAVSGAASEPVAPAGNES